MQATTGPRRPSKLPTTAAVISVLAFLGTLVLGGGLSLPWLLGRELMRSWQEMGPWAYFVVAATSLTVSACVGLLVARGWKPGVPAALFLGFGALPWLVGATGTLASSRTTLQAVANVNPMDKGVILANGFSESLTSQIFGGGLSVLLLLGLAVGLGTAALLLSRRPKEQVAEGPAFEAARPAWVALLCLALALALGARLPSGGVYKQALEATANVNPADRALILADAASRLGTVAMVSRGGLVAALALVVGALMLRRRSAGVLGAALGAAAAVAPAFALHGLGYQRMRDEATAWGALPWASAGDFQPATLVGSSRGTEPANALVTLTHLKPAFDATAPEAPLADAAQVSRALVLPPESAERDEDEVLRVALGGETEDGPVEAKTPLEPELRLAMDARLEAEGLRRLLEAASQRGVRSLRFVGEVRTFAADNPLASDALLAPFTHSVRATQPVALFSTLPEGEPRAYPPGWQAVLSGKGVVVARPYRLDDAPPLTLDLAEPVEQQYERRGGPFGPPSRPVYLVVEDGATAGHVARVLDALMMKSDSDMPLLPVLVTAALPEAAAPVAGDGAR